MTAIRPVGVNPGSDSHLDTEVGRLCRVISVADERTVVVELRGGNEGRLSADSGLELKIGDVLLLQGNTFESLPATVWPAGDRIGTIAFADDSNVLVRAAGQVHAFPVGAGSLFAEGQTVRVGPDGQPLEVITQRPIDSIGLSREDSFDIESLIVQSEDNTTTLDDFGGKESLVQRAVDLVSVALSADEPLRKMGVKPIKGILFSGPSGTGKTYLARALANLTEAAFYNIGGPMIVDQFVGQSERRLREIFDHANGNGPAILFFDEIDSLYTQRGDKNHEATNRLVGQFLALLDGFVSYDRVLIIAATNLPGALDDALLRPGRLGHKLNFTIPAKRDRELILRSSSRNIALLEEPDLASVAAVTEGWTAADLAAVWTEAGIAAALDRRTAICRDDILIGVDAVQSERNVRLEGR
jgi:transitional endoplasmic reticulum ATPase